MTPGGFTASNIKSALQSPAVPALNLPTTSPQPAHAINQQSFTLTLNLCHFSHRFPTPKLPPVIYLPRDLQAAHSAPPQTISPLSALTGNWRSQEADIANCGCKRQTIHYC